VAKEFSFLKEDSFFRALFLTLMLFVTKINNYEVLSLENSKKLIRKELETKFKGAK
jgi:hypothetical protein